MKEVKYRKKLPLFVKGRLLFTLLLILQIILISAPVLFLCRIYWVRFALCVFSALTALHLFMNSKKYAIRNSWMFLVLVFPHLGGILYWILHSQTASRAFGKRAQKDAAERFAEYRTLDTAKEPEFKNPQDQYFRLYLKNTAAFPIYQDTDVCYFEDGEKMLSSLLVELQKAEKFIFMEYYTLEEGVMWNSMLDILRERVKAGVDVRVIYDDFGSFLTLPTNYRKTLRSYGIQCEVFNRFSPRLTTRHNNRDHRKITVIDGKTVYTGGINLADEYINYKKCFGHWRDSAVRMQGTITESFTAMFLQTWQLLAGTRESVRDLIPESNSLPSSKKDWVQPYADDPTGNIRVGERIVNHAIYRSKSTLYISSPYLIIGEEVISALCACAQRGVDVRIVTPGIPDKKAVFFTTRSHYRKLIAAGVKIYEYTPGFVHAKLIASDDDFCVVGSTNMDFRSFYINRECGACFFGETVAKEVKADLLNMISVSREVSEKDCKTNLITRFAQSVCRIFAPLM